MQSSQRFESGQLEKKLQDLEETLSDANRRIQLLESQLSSAQVRGGAPCAAARGRRRLGCTRALLHMQAACIARQQALATFQSVARLTPVYGWGCIDHWQPPPPPPKKGLIHGPPKSYQDWTPGPWR